MRIRRYIRIKKGLPIFLLAGTLCVLISFFIAAILNQIEKNQNDTVRVLMPDGKMKKMELEDYLVGVLAAEMPAEFEPEALKAQAVAARTYVLKRKEDSKDLADYDVDTTEKTQAWCSNREMSDKWGFFKYWQYKEKLSRAVQATKGKVITYRGKKIEALFFSSCGRKPTEFSQEVWGNKVNYLVSVSSEESNSARSAAKQDYDIPTFYQLLGIKDSAGSFSKTDIVVMQKTGSGRIKQLTVKGKRFESKDFRSKLKLNSTDFEWTVSQNKIIFTVYGKGHGVGMSQYGANDMAKAGRNFEEILKHYYTGTEISQVEK
ncbi:stage II sporulation protein D [Syntrophobotulus glycolicus DSM 8271]|uniref:Stage II sporulation protein D n=1 Tax=Syntrophobotulus glycolicus (strain DSM 8271 / FlGlyR) TaxID=645991 RepID=F0T2A2_SYNGF|nr:stage II sporulation protein D [Syntrophobotulus glycolicus]ADY57530.1 stage II sporulation protein D [Syntrophobotulus glycolicus DSM 8271]